MSEHRTTAASTYIAKEITDICAINKRCSYGWASKAVTEIRKWNDEHLHFEAVGSPVEIKQALTAETKAQCEALGRAMAERLKA